MKITFDDLEDYLFSLYGKEATEQNMFLKLVEEMGEVAEIINMRAGIKKVDVEDTQQELANELADIIHYAVAIAAINKINLSDIIIEKDKKASVKYCHNTNLEEFLLHKL